MKSIKLNEQETKTLLECNIVVIERNGFEIVIEKNPNAENGFEIYVMNPYNKVELSKKFFKRLG